MQDIFISHAGSDKESYINLLIAEFTAKNITYWLSDFEILWGDSIVLSINEGLRDSEFVLLCLSQAFIGRPWPEAELNAILNLQYSNGFKKVLPLILNHKEEVLAQYPILAGLAYREFSSGVSTIADEIKSICKHSTGKREIQITVESVHTGKLCNICANPKVSIKWLSDKAQTGMGVSDLADTKAYEPFHIRWVLVDVRAEEDWLKLQRYDKQRIRAVLATDKGVVYSKSDTDRLIDLGIRNNSVFHIYPIEDIHDFPPPAFSRHKI